jgi:hypothetical protein
METERLLLIFERSPDESGLTGVGEATRALEQSGIAVKDAAKNPGVDGLIGRLLRFWFPYVSNAGIIGVVPGEAELGEFIITLGPGLGPTFGAELGAWLQARHGRKIRVKCEGVEIEAQTPEQVETLLARLDALGESRKPARAKTP